MLPAVLPLFPLPNVVLFPGTCLPLHVFEPRYRAMTADALAGDRVIGMVLLRPGWEADYDGRPPIYSVGCAGFVTHSERIGDGRFNLVLQGQSRFVIEHEEPGGAYRRAAVRALPDKPPASAPRLHAARLRLEQMLAPIVEAAGGELRVPPSMSDIELIHALAQYLDLEPVERQALLELDGPLARCDALVDLLEMRQLAARAGAPSARH